MTTASAGHRPREAVFHAYPRLIFAWPIILLGFLLYPLDAWGWARPDILAWLWGSTLLVVILTLGVHVNRSLSLFCAVLGSAVWLLGIYLRDVKGLATRQTVQTELSERLDVDRPRAAYFLDVVVGTVAETVSPGQLQDVSGQSPEGLRDALSGRSLAASWPAAAMATEGRRQSRDAAEKSSITPDASAGSACVPDEAADFPVVRPMAQNEESDRDR